MLNTQLSRITAYVGFLLLVLTAIVATPASAAPGGECVKQGFNGECVAWAPSPGDDGGGGGDDGTGHKPGDNGTNDNGTGDNTHVSTCVYQGKDIPCATTDGQWSASHGCYIKKSNPQPEKAPEESKDKSVTGNWYDCTKPDGGTEQIFIDDDDATLLVNPVNPEDLARRALAGLKLKAVTVGIAPKTSEAPEDQGIVGMPVWLWVSDPANNTTGPASNSASEGGVTVNLDAKVTSYSWDMGDGQFVKCHNAGTEWKEGMTGDSPSGCSYNYLDSGIYDIAATTNWTITWEGGGMRGTMTMALTSPAETMHVTEAQTIVVH